jgi:hypothetical protein
MSPYKVRLKRQRRRARARARAATAATVAKELSPLAQIILQAMDRRIDELFNKAHTALLAGLTAKRS